MKQPKQDIISKTRRKQNLITFEKGVRRSQDWKQMLDFLFIDFILDIALLETHFYLLATLKVTTVLWLLYKNASTKSINTYLSNIIEHSNLHVEF